MAGDQYGEQAVKLTQAWRVFAGLLPDEERVMAVREMARLLDEGQGNRAEVELLDRLTTCGDGEWGGWLRQFRLEVRALWWFRRNPAPATHGRLPEVTA